jgi:DNA mismatch repair protein MutH
LAKPRAFTYKNAYMTYVLNNYIVPGKSTYERIVPDEAAVPFEEYVQGKINGYRGRSVDELCRQFGIDKTRNAKNLFAIIAYRILGITGNRAEEFEKAGIAVKTIRIGKNGKIKENMSFPHFKFKELIAEDWETSTFGTYLSETRFLFVVYRFDENDVLRLCGCQFWNIPYSDLNDHVRVVWERTRQVISDGLKIEVVNGVNKTNFPKQSEDPVCHVRPHAKNAADTDELPDGRMFPKQCFWLNNSYILGQINPDLKQ